MAHEQGAGGVSITKKKKEEKKEQQQREKQKQQYAKRAEENKKKTPAATATPAKATTESNKGGGGGSFSNAKEVGGGGGSIDKKDTGYRSREQQEYNDVAERNERKINQATRPVGKITPKGTQITSTPNVYDPRYTPAENREIARSMNGLPISDRSAYESVWGKGYAAPTVTGRERFKAEQTENVMLPTVNKRTKKYGIDTEPLGNPSRVEQHYAGHHRLPQGNDKLSGSDWQTKAAGEEFVYNINGKRVTESDLRAQGYSEEVLYRLRALAGWKTTPRKDQLKQIGIEMKSAGYSPDVHMRNVIDSFRNVEEKIVSGDFSDDRDRTNTFAQYDRLKDEYYRTLSGDALEQEIRRTEELLAQTKAKKTATNDIVDPYRLIGRQPGQTGADVRAGQESVYNTSFQGNTAAAVLENKLAALRMIQASRQQAELLDRIRLEGDYDAFTKWYALQTKVGTEKTNDAWEGVANALSGTYSAGITDPTQDARQRAAYDELNKIAAALKKKGYSAEDFRLFDAYKDNQIYQQQSKGLMEYVNAHPVAGPLAAAGLQVVTSPVRGISRIVSDTATGGMGYQTEKGLTTAVKEATQQAAQNIERTHGKVWSKVYQYSVSAAESFFMGTTLGPATSVVMGMNAAVDAYDEALERGIDRTNAVALGITSGIFEALFEYISLDKVEWLDKKTAKSVALTFAKDALIEGTEEVNTDLANEIADYLLAGGLSKFNAAKAQGMTAEQYAAQFCMQLLDSFAGGTFGGVAFGLAKGVRSGFHVGTDAAKNTIYDAAAGKSINQNGDVTELIDEAKASGDSQSIKLAEKLEAKLADGKSADRLAGQLYNRMQGNTVQQAATQRFKEIAEEKGVTIEAWEAEEAGRGIAAATNRNHLSEKQAKVLDGEVGQQLCEEASSGAEWFETNRGERLDFARRTGAVDDNSGREMRTAEAVAKRAQDVTKAIREGDSYTLVKNGFEGQYVGKEGQRSEAKLGGIDSIGEHNELMVVVDDDGKGGPHATAAFSVGENAPEGTVQAADADTEILYLDAQAYLTGNADMAQPEQYGADYQYRDGATMSVAAANTALATYDSRVNPDAHGYMAWFFDAHKAGKSGVSWERYLSLYNQRGAAEWSGYITEEQLREAFRTGQMEFSPRDGVTRIGNRDLKAGEGAFIAVLDHIAKAMKTPIVIVDDIAGQNGFVSSRADVAVISLDADFGTFTVAAFHEIFHVFGRELRDSELGDSAGRHFISAVLNEYRATVGKERFRKEYDRMAERYKEELQGITGEDLEWKVKEEMAAQYFGVVASNNMDGLVKRLHIEGGQQLVQKVLDTLKEFAQHLKDALKKLAGVDDATRHALRAEAEQVDRILDLFTEAVRQTEGVREERLAEQGETLRKAAEVSAESGVRSAENYSLKAVAPVEPSSDAWERTLTTEEAMRRFPNLWNVSAEESDTRNPTQVKVTVSSYRKIYDILKSEGFNGTILDASSGLGYGTRAGREEYGFDVDDIEPYPGKDYHPKYKDYSAMNKKYDVIISNAVLNVLPQDQRDALTVKMGEMLNDGGRLFVNVRGNDVFNASSLEVIDRDKMEVYISKSGSYQKGFTKAELKAYLKDALGDGFTVETTNKFGAVAAVVTKAERETETSSRKVTDADYMAAVERGDMEAAQEMVDEEKEDIRWSRKVTDARAELAERTLDRDELGAMLDETAEFLRQARKTVDKAEYDAWIQGLRTGGRVPQRTALLKVVRQYNDPKVTGESNEALADRIVERLAEMTDAEYSVDALIYTLADAMYRRAAATEAADTTNESREAIREVTKGRKYYINDGDFNYLVEQTAGTRRGMNEVFRRVYGFTLYPQSEAERRGATDSVGSIPGELKKQGKSWQYEQDEGRGNLWAILGGSYDEDVMQDSDVSTALQLYEMRDDMLPQARTLEDDVRDRLKKEAPDAQTREQWVAETIYEEAYQDAARFAEDIIRLSPMRTLADAYEGTMEELRQAAKGVMDRRAKEIAAIAERLDAAETALGRAGDISEEQRQEAARLERQVKNLEDQLSVARYDLQKAKDAGQKDTAALEQRITQLEKKSADNAAELRKLNNAVRAEQRKVARRDAKIQATRQYYIQKRHEETLKRADTASRQRKRQRIRTKVRWLNDRLTSPAEGKYIPPEMRDGIAAFVKNFLQEDTTAKGNSSLFTAEQLHQLNAYYGRLQTDADGWDSFFDEDVAEIIRRMSNADDELSLIGKRLADLPRDQLGKLEEVVDNLVANVRNANRMFGNLRNRMLSADGDRFISQIDHKQPQGRLAEIYNNLRTGKLNMNMIKPIWLFKDVLGGEIERYFTDLQHARNAWAFRVDIGREYFADKKKQYNYNKWQKETNSFTLDDGTAVTLTKDAVLQIYATWMRERQSITPTNHLMGGGIVLTEDLQKIQKKKNLTKDQQKKLEEEQTRLIDKKAHSLTLRDIETMLGTLTPEQKDYADDILRFLSTTVAGWGNETSRELSGFDKFTEGYYFPYQSSSLYLYHQMGVSDDTRLKNSGFTKSLTMKASTPIVITGFSEVAGKHVIDMANYSTLALPLENMHRLVNYRNRQDPKNMTSVQASMNDVFGSQMYDYIRRFLNQMNGGVKRDSLTTLPEKLFSGFKRSAVAMNISVIVQQPSAIARAMALVNPKYFVATTAHWFDWKELQKYSGVAKIKAMGSWDINTDRSTVDYVLGNSSAMDKWNQFTGKGAELADAITWSHIWNAVKRETAKKLGIKYKRKGMTEEFYQAAAERFNEVTDYTQVYDATITRSQWMRSEDGLHKIMTQFMAEPTTSYNLLMFSGMKKNGNHINKAAAIAALVCNTVLNTALQSLVGAWRDKDKKSYWERYFKKFIEGVFGTRKNGFLLDSELNVANMIPFVQDILSLLQGWDVSRSDMSLIADLIKSFNKLKEKFEKRDDDEALWDFMKENGELINNFLISALNFSPVPAKTIYRDFVKAPMNAIDHIRNGGYKTAAQHIADIWKQNFEGEWDNNEALYNAVIRNDRAALAEYTKVTDADIAKYVNEANDEFSAEQHARNLKEKDFHNKVQDALKAMDSRIEDAARALLDYDFATANRLADAIEQDGFDRNDIVKAITETRDDMLPDKEYNDSEISTAYFANYEMLRQAYYAGNVAHANAVRDELHGQGKTDKKIDEEIQETINDDFKTGEIDLDEARQAYSDYTTFTDAKITEKLVNQVANRYAELDDMSLEEAKQMYTDLNVKEEKIANNMGKLIVSDYSNKKLTDKDAAVRLYMEYTGEQESTATISFDYYDLKASDETFPLEFSAYKTYREKGLDTVGISVGSYASFLTQTSGMDGSTANDKQNWFANNQKKFGNVQAQILPVIDKMDLTVEQKDALYLSKWAEKNRLYAPWHNPGYWSGLLD